MPDETPEAIVFDLGGVIVDWQPRYVYETVFDDAAELDFFLRNVCNGAWLGLMGAKVVVWLAACGLFAYVSWVHWPWRSLATPDEFRAYRREGIVLAAGMVLRVPPDDARVSGRIRAMLSTRLDGEWSSDAIARSLAMSEATLRRRLAAEGVTLRELIADVRMASALVLLQATSRPVSEIASAVGYDSPSRFAVRFRDRFGFAPTAVRGHARAG